MWPTHPYSSPQTHPLISLITRKMETARFWLTHRSLSWWRIALLGGAGLMGLRGIWGCISWQFCIILEFLGFRVGGWNFSPTARSIVLFQLTFYFCFLFVFLESGDGNGTGNGNGNGSEAGHAWHSAWVAHYLMMLFAIFSHLSAWFLLVEFFTVSPAKVSVSCCFSFSFFYIFHFFFLSFPFHLLFFGFACFQCRLTFSYFLFDKNFFSLGWANKDFEIW